MTDNLHIVDEVEQVVEDNPLEYKTRTGALLRLKKVNKLIVAEASKKIRMPKVPIWMNPDKGREEENPNDPDYLESVQNAKIEQGMLIYSIYLAYGTEVISLPASIDPLDSTDWSDELSMIAGIDIPNVGRSRYVAWMKYKVIDDEEMNILITRIMRVSGAIKEEDVQKVMDSFRGDQIRNTSEGVSTT